ncbi:acyl-CoA dehydrogenase family protein [Pusillimonas sp. ANT_WB101]|uniref:acyl-CoA dehydrogenase family protein n=1 Tax=Pusillimonas sp. ANT_WB101 TaxID=2597356 RepID=UPI0011EF1651|nr:acyl-CoA dehydrogenase family protein [Pusillimonas sp. ANT_WB101]KAA0890807.1 acyl-CoA dehydrogenase [Pusillimonas sp. ANT_WB101]
MQNKSLNPLPHDNCKSLQSLLDGIDPGWNIGQSLHYLVNSSAGGLPLPGSGHTLDRWRLLAQVGHFDLSLAKLFEGHTDALAILHELKSADLHSAGQVWGVWCAEPPGQSINFTETGGDGVGEIYGTKPWCSGARYVDWALMSAWNNAGDPCLLAVDMTQPEVEVTSEGWHAVGMQATASHDVECNGARARRVGQTGAYVSRPGFYHGSGGVAACWYGAAAGIVEIVQKSLQDRPEALHSLAHLGAMDVALAQAACLLRTAAHDIDANPYQSCEYSASRARLAVESAAETILVRASRALGAGPLCKNERFARMMADLPVFIRQSHAERDLAAHGFATTRHGGAELWSL